MMEIYIKHQTAVCCVCCSLSIFVQARAHTLFCAGVNMCFHVCTFAERCVCLFVVSRVYGCSSQSCSQQCVSICKEACWYAFVIYWPEFLFLWNAFLSGHLHLFSFPVSFFLSPPCTPPPPSLSSY